MYLSVYNYEKRLAFFVESFGDLSQNEIAGSTKNIGSRPVYVTTEIEQEFTTGMQRVPEGLALRVYDDSIKHEMRNVPFEFRQFARQGRLEDALVNMYATSCNAQGMYWLQAGNIDSARTAFRTALQFNPNSIGARNLLTRIGQ